MLLLFLVGASAGAPPAPRPSGVPLKPQGIRQDGDDEEIVAIITAMWRTGRWGAAAMTEQRAAIKVPSYVRRNAERGLRYHADGHGGDGLVPQTIEDARDLAAGRVSERKIRKIGPWVARHIVDLKAPANSNPGDAGFPGPGLVAMLLWGAGPDAEGARRTQQWAERETEALDKKSRA